jgi:hypothetical protein
MRVVRIATHESIHKEHQAEVQKLTLTLPKWGSDPADEKVPFLCLYFRYLQPPLDSILYFTIYYHSHHLPSPFIPPCFSYLFLLQSPCVLERATFAMQAVNFPHILANQLKLKAKLKVKLRVKKKAIIIREKSNMAKGRLPMTVP